MRSATLRHRSTLQALRRTESSVSGEMLSEWVDVAVDVPTGLASRSAGEREEAQKQVHRVTYDATIRYRADLTHDMRLIIGGRAFNIRSIENLDERNRELRLVISTVTATSSVEEDSSGSSGGTDG